MTFDSDDKFEWNDNMAKQNCKYLKLKSLLKLIMTFSYYLSVINFDIANVLQCLVGKNSLIIGYYDDYSNYLYTVISNLYIYIYIWYIIL